MRRRGISSIGGATVLAVGIAIACAAPSSAADAAFRPQGFAEHIEPLVRRYCADCHAAGEAEGELSLDRFRSAADVLADRKPWQKVLKQLQAGAMPPDGAARPSADEVAAAIAWLEAALVHIDRDRPIDPGRVTVRRLNRTEYNNTIRDLFGVAIRPADEFPEDDVGYGFDNIGDVLSVSPLRAEQYLNAAERLTTLLRGYSDRPVFDEFIEAGHLRFRGVPSRNNSDRGKELVPGTELYVEFELPLPGEYEVRINAWGVEKPTEKDRDNNQRWLEAEKAFQLDPDAKPVVEATLVCDDRVIGHVPVVPGNATTALKQVYKLKFTEQAGFHTLRVRHRFSRDMTPAEVAAFRDKPLLAPRLGLRLIGVRGPFRTGDARLAPAMAALHDGRTGTDASPRDAARTALKAVADRAFRRPASANELDELTEFGLARHAEGRTFDEALDLAVQAILVSPAFLYRTEATARPHDAEHIAPLDDYALASRLSYFLWVSMPDDELLGLAAAGRLQDSEVLAQQVERMLADPRSAAFVEAFFGQWLELRKVLDVSVDRALFETFSTELKDDLRTETMLFVESIVRENRSAVDLLTADYSFLNGRLAEHYGIKGVDKKADFAKVSLVGTPRRGVLTHGSVLLLTSYPNRTSPTRRGNWILETILGEEPPPPPDNVPQLEQTQAASPDLPLRKQLELHRVNPTCVSCHRTMDAIGFGFENFDAIGRWREQDRGQPIDASGDLPSGETFAGPDELIGHLSRREAAFVRHLSGKLLTYALGRGLEYYDRPALDDIAAATRPDGYRFQDIVREVVLSRPFRLHRGEQNEASE